MGKREISKIFDGVSKFSEIEGKFETRGNASLPQGGWTPLSSSAVLLFPSLLSLSACFASLLLLCTIVFLSPSTETFRYVASHSATKDTLKSLVQLNRTFLSIYHVLVSFLHHPITATNNSQCFDYRVQMEEVYLHPEFLT